MAQTKSNRVFNRISPVYGLFYENQRSRYAKIIQQVTPVFDVAACDSVLDIGCGTGALCSVMEEMGLAVTGVDAAVKMVEIAKKRDMTGNIRYELGDVLQGLAYEDKSFDMVITSYVAHGLQEEERKMLYREMSRLARKMVIIHDYNKNRSPLTNFIEWLEGGDYFRFIHVAEEEMRNCLQQMKNCFSSVRVLDVDKRAAWYLCEVVDPFSGAKPSHTQ